MFFSGNQFVARQLLQTDDKDRFERSKMWVQFSNLNKDNKAFAFKGSNKIIGHLKKQICGI